MKYFFIFIGILFSTGAFAQSNAELYNRASILFDKGDYKSAIVHIDKALRKDSTELNYLLLKANSLFLLKDYQRSFNLFSDIIEMYPSNTVPLNQRGLLLRTIQKFDESIEDFTDALKLTKNDSIRNSLYINRGASKIGIRDYDGAYKDFMKAYKIDSLNIGTLNNIATVCDEVGKGDETLSYLFKIIKINPKFSGAYVNIGFKYQQDSDYVKAIEYFTKAIKLSPKEPLAYSNRSFNYLKVGNLKAALADVNKSIELYPENSFAFKNRALIYLALRKTNNACSDLDKAIDLGFNISYGAEATDLLAKYCVKKPE